jgi:hypothetical protein
MTSLIMLYQFDEEDFPGERRIGFYFEREAIIPDPANPPQVESSPERILLSRIWHQPLLPQAPHLFF